jgi:hypothetical protein
MDPLYWPVIVIEGIGLLTDLLTGNIVQMPRRDYSTCTSQLCHDRLFPQTDKTGGFPSEVED